jgi:putative methyltransferase (TIGR04325 family)
MARRFVEPSDLLSINQADVAHTESSLIGPAERVRAYLRAVRSLLGQIRDEVYVTRVELSAHLTQLESLVSLQTARIEQLSAVVDTGVSDLSRLESLVKLQAERVAELSVGVQAGVSSREAQHAQVVEILRVIHDRAHWRRTRLRELRASEAYERAYSDSEPLVSVVIPTYDNHSLLRERAIPSVLAQTHQNFEIVVVGDGAADEARIAAESFGDPRVTFFNRLYRGPYPVQPDLRWLVAGVPAYNEAVHRARGLWIAPLDDDDAFRPHHIERLLEHARRHRLELCYGQLCAHLPNGSTGTVGRFPPEHGQFGVQAALYHEGLGGIFELELADAALGLPYDWGMCRRMMEADVRIGMLEEVTADYYPSRHWTPRWDETPVTSEADAPLPAPEADLPLPTRIADLPEWEYVPEGFARARVSGQQAAIGWRADDVARAYREKWPRFLAAIEGSGPLGVGHEVVSEAPIGRHDVIAQNTVLAFAFALARATNGSGSLSVLDRGGALGHYYVLAKRLFPELKLDYHCWELPAVCEQGREVLPDVSFHHTNDCLGRSYDLVLASGSLQYTEGWQDLMRQLAAASAQWMFLTRVPIVRQHASFVVMQRAHAYGYATEYIGWVFNRGEFLGVADSAGLELERELVLLDELPVDGAPEAFTHDAFLFRVNGAC